MADLLGILRIKDSNGNWVSVPGLKGDTGEPFKILGIYATAAALEAAVEDPGIGDVYLVGTTGAYDIYLYLADGWHNTGRYMPKGDQGDPAPAASITSAVETWLAANVDPETGYVLDRTLSLETAAAPADLVGEIKSSLWETKEYTEEYSKGHVTNLVAVGRPIDPLGSTSQSYAGIVVKCKKGDIFVITGTGGNAPRLWGFVDANMLGITQWSNSSITETNLQLVAEQDGYFISNVKYTDGAEYSLVATQQIEHVASIDYVSKKIAEKAEVIFLTDFGAVGDGVTDDTTAINSALTEAQGKILFVPPGTYLFSGTLNVHSGTTIIGSGEQSVFKLANTFTLSQYEWRPEDGGNSTYKWGMMLLDDQSNGIVLRNFVIEGQTSAFVDQAEVALAVRGTNHVIENIVTKDINYFPDSFSGRQYNAPGEGIELFKASNIIVTNCKCYNCGYEGIGTESTTDALIQNCIVGDTNQTGIQIHRSSKRVKVNGCSVEYSENARAGSSCTLHANVGVDMGDIWIVNNSFDKGVTLVGGAENDVHFLGNTVKSGALTRNGSVYRKNWIISGNKFLAGGIVNQIDNCIISDNFLTVNAGYQMINMRGNNVVANGNVALGSVSGIYIEPHE